MNSFGRPECSGTENARRLRSVAPRGTNGGNSCVMFLVRADPPNFA